MKKLAIGATLALGIFGLAACGSEDPDTVVETDAGEVTKEEFYEAMKAQAGEIVLRDLVTKVVLQDKYEVSDKDIKAEIEEIEDQLGEQFDMWKMQEGIQDDADLEDFIELRLLQEKAITEGVEVSEEEVKERYDRMNTEIEAMHILVEDEDEAKDIKKKLDDGEDFEELAKEHSVDEGTAEDGGKLPYFSTGEMVPEFEDAAFELEIDVISDPVQSDFGFHIIQVTDKREKEDGESFDEMKATIERQLMGENVDPEEAYEKLEGILEDANIKIKIKELEDIFETEEAVG